MAKKKSPTVMSDKAMAAWNKAEDLRIEQMLKDAGIRHALWSAMTTEEIYEELTKGETK
jgi:hypothetical protein